MVDQKEKVAGLEHTDTIYIHVTIAMAFTRRQSSLKSQDRLFQLGVSVSHSYDYPITDLFGCIILLAYLSISVFHPRIYFSPLFLLGKTLEEKNIHIGFYIFL